MRRIKQLPINLVNQIAAGEVIERPASVVKELVENSIDAGATRIEIAISNDCRNIRIADNGSGIHPDDIQLAFVKHATSKLSDEKSLFDIQTLGFRGEALASIISIAKVTCTTRTKDFDYGTKVVCENSIVNSAKTGCAQGTIMDIKELFFNQPARLKFLKSAKTEFSYIQELIQSLAISHPHIAFILKNNGSDILVTTQNADLLTRITQIYPSDIIKELKEVFKTDLLTGIKISGYVSIPSYTRSSKKSIYTFVNSRTVKCPILLKAIDVAYKNMLPNGRYPFAVINLEIDSAEIDVNAHPTKREIRYKNPNQIFNFVQSSINQALNAIEKKENRQNVEFTSTQNNEKIIPFNNNISNVINDDIQIKENDKNEKDLFPFNYKSKQVKQEEIKPTVEQKTIDINFEIPEKFKRINIIGQYNNTYILVENEDNLEIIDQHIAEERYIYEKLKSEKEINSQLLIISDILNIEPSDIEILENAKEQLKKFGYQIEKVSENQVIFKKIPQVLSNVVPQDILSELLTNLKDSPDNNLDTKEEKILITTSCKAAVKAGQKLTPWQMEEIVKKLRTTKNPYTCPHGRPISHFIPLKEVASFFDRQNK